MLSKRKLVKVFLAEMLKQSKKKIDFLLYIGADTSDEPVFKYLKRQTEAQSASKTLKTQSKEKTDLFN